MKKHGFSMIELVVSLMLLGIIYLNVAGLFKTNLHQDQVFYGTFADTWNQYNTVIDAVYNRKSIPLTSTTATVVLTDVATLLEQEMLSNTPTVIAKDSVVLQKLSVQYKLPTHKDIKYDILSINTLDNKITASSGVIQTDQIQSYLPVHKTRVWTLVKNKAYITSSTQYNKYFPDFANIQKLTYVKLASPVEFNYGNNFKDTLFYSHLYYVYSSNDNIVPYVLGYDSNGYGIAIKASDQIAYPTYLTRTNGGAKYAYKIDEFPVIPLRQAFYYAGMPILFEVQPSGSTRNIKISISEVKPSLTPETKWGDFVGQTGVFASYTYRERCDNFVNGECTVWSLDANNAANKITVNNWIEPRTNILLTSDIVELTIGNYFSGPFFYGRTVIPINLIYELSRGKIYATTDSKGNIVLSYHQNTHLTSPVTDTQSLAEKVKVSNTKSVNNNYNFPWGDAQCVARQTTRYPSAIDVTTSTSGNALLQTQNMLAKDITFNVTVTPINYADPIEVEGSCETVRFVPVECIKNGEVCKCSGPGDAGNQECAQKCGSEYRCFIDNVCKREDPYYTKWNWKFQENVAYLYGGIRITKVTANISTPQGNTSISWDTNVYRSMDSIPKTGTSFQITVPLPNPDPAKLLNSDPILVKTLFDPNYKKTGDIKITYDFTFKVTANAQVNVYCGSVECYTARKMSQEYLRELPDMLRGINVNITPNKDKSTFIPAFTYIEPLPYDTYSFKALPNDQLYLFTSAYTENAGKLKDFTGWYTTDDTKCGSGVICSILSSDPMQELGLYSRDYVVTKPDDSRYYLKNSPGQVRNNISNDTHYAIFHGYTPNVRLEGRPTDSGGRISVIGKKPLTLSQINAINIQISRITIKQSGGGPVPYQ